jgi:hypothetical protein
VLNDPGAHWIKLAPLLSTHGYEEALDPSVESCWKDRIQIIGNQVAALSGSGGSVVLLPA